MPEDWEAGGFGLYLHWPFCEAKCPYCDFNSYVVDNIEQKRWRDAYLRELGRIGGLAEGRILNSVFFGGGTPSLMDPDVVADIIETIRRTWRTSNDVEITLEANPSSVEAERFRAYAQAGVNRVSLGVQALSDTALRLLGRLHSVKEAREALDVARSHFDRMSFDLIYARQDQSVAEWRAELGAALSMRPDHLSLYQLTIEDGTAFGQRHALGKLAGLPGEDASAEMFELTQDLCAEAGLPAYEVSNHARAGEASRHNLIYWRSGDYAGIGPGAHGRLTLGQHRFGTETHRAPMAWLKQVEDAGNGETPRQIITPRDHVAEFLLMGLRLEEGVDEKRLKRISGGALQPRIEEMVADGWLQRQSDTIRVTPRHRMVLNGVLRMLLEDY